MSEVSPEPTFLAKLRAAREVATPEPWSVGDRRGRCHIDHHHEGPPLCRYDYSWDANIAQINRGEPDPSVEPDIVIGQWDYDNFALGKGNADLICLLVNNAEDIERLVEAAAEYPCPRCGGSGWQNYPRCTPDGEPIGEETAHCDDPMCAALRALNGGPS